MKNILIPMDFTDVGINALRFALNAFPNSSYSVLHIRSNNIDMSSPFPSDLSLPLDKGIFSDLDWNNALHVFIQNELKIKNLPERLTTNIKYGPIVSEINKYIEQIEFDAIVMGTRDKYNYFDKFLGTISFSIAKSSSIPLYLIPKHATHKGFNKVLIAIDYEVENTDFLNKFKKWNEDHSAFAKFLHVKYKKDKSHQLATQSIVDRLFEDSDPKFSFEIAEWEDNKIAQSLLAAAYDQKSDLLIVMPKPQGQLESIFFESISKDLIMKAELPILFIK